MTRTSRPARTSAVSLLAGSTLLAGCTTGPGAGPDQGPSFASIEELHSAVDEVLRCPAFDTDNTVQIALPDGDVMEGLTCGEGIVMGWSEDPEEVQDARDMLSDSVASRPAVEGPGWFVVDAQDAVPPQSPDGPEPHQPDSRDLDLLAEELDANYIEY